MTKIGETLNTWKHISFVRDTGENYTVLYVDGIRQYRRYVSGMSRRSLTATIFALGGNPNDSLECAQETTISDLRIYDTILYPPEIRKVKNKGKLLYF